jgi:hypothetical protein
MDTGGGEVTADADADALWSNGHVVNLFLDPDLWMVAGAGDGAWSVV